MRSSLIEVTRIMCPALIAALAVSLATSAVVSARRRLARIAWPEAIAVELRLTAAVRTREGRQRVRDRRWSLEARAPLRIEP